MRKRNSLNLLSLTLGVLALAGSPAWAQTSDSKQVNLTIDNYANVSYDSGTLPLAVPITIPNAGITGSTPAFTSGSVTFIVKTNTGFSLGADTTNLGAITGNPALTWDRVSNFTGAGATTGSTVTFRASVKFPTGTWFPNYDAAGVNGTITLSFSIP